MIRCAKRTPAVPLALVLLCVTGMPQAGDRPGDAFRQAAMDLTQASGEAVGNAAHADGRTAGRYLELAAVYRAMATIKERAAVLADVERWDEIHWDRYRELEQERDTILSALHDTTYALPVADADGRSAEDAAESFRLQAQDAGRHAVHADGAERAVFDELAVVLSQMAAIKGDASAQVDGGGDYDRARYEALSRRRDTLERMLEAGR